MVWHLNIANEGKFADQRDGIKFTSACDVSAHSVTMILFRRFLANKHIPGFAKIIRFFQGRSVVARGFLQAAEPIKMADDQCNHCDFKTFSLIIGNSRSGSTILGSIVDAHPNAIVANETMASQAFWKEMSKGEILDEIIANSSANYRSGRQSEDYQYQIGASPESKSSVCVYGDKIWNPATLLLHGDYDLISRLESQLAARVVLIASIRNPFDAIATMHRRSQAPIKDRIRWFFMHCEALAAIEEKTAQSDFLISYHEQLIDCPNEEISRICRALMLPVNDQHLANVKRLLYRRPSKSGAALDWKLAEVEEVLERMQRFPFLTVYENQTP